MQNSSVHLSGLWNIHRFGQTHMVDICKKHLKVLGSNFCVRLITRCWGSCLRPRSGSSLVQVIGHEETWNWTGTTSWTPLKVPRHNWGSSCIILPSKPCVADFCQRFTDSNALRCSKCLQAGAKISTIPRPWVENIFQKSDGS